MKRWIFLLSLVCTSAIAANFLNGKGTNGIDENHLLSISVSMEWVKKQFLNKN